MTTTIDTPTTDHGAVLVIPLNQLKKSPRNARKMPHGQDAIEALAASIAAKTMLQPIIVEPELRENDEPTGYYLVTIGEGRRQAQLLRAKRKQIKKTEPIRCIVDTANDAHEISLDENITRTAMHPADQFEAFHRLADERGLSAEEISTRFGVTATVVRQRLRLAVVSPKLMQTYRDGGIALDQLMAFTLTDDHVRQDALWETLPSWERSPSAIRRHLTTDRIPGDSRYALFIGTEAYQAAGGVIERDLFADDRGGYFVDPGLLQSLALEKLQITADEIETAGWKWVAVNLDYPSDHGCSRLYPEVRDFTADEQVRYDGFLSELEALEAIPLSDENEARAVQLAGEIDALDAARTAFTSEDKARAGVFVSIGREGATRIDHGFVRSEDDVEEDEGDEGPDPQTNGSSGRSALSDKLIADLTAHRTAGLRDALASQPDVAFTALLHSVVLRAFDSRNADRSCLDIRATQVSLQGYSSTIPDSRAQQNIDERHEAWAVKLAAREDDLWNCLFGLPHDEALALLAHCISLSVNAIQTTDRPRGVTAADTLARALGLSMTSYWTPTAESYFGRVSKDRIVEAVSEAVSEDAARRMGTGKKRDMALAAEGLVANTGWLPDVLRTPNVEEEPAALAAE